MDFEKISFLASPTASAQEALAALEKEYGNSSPEEADVFVAIGGDGFMLQTMHAQLRRGVPIFGMHKGSVGFLMNRFNTKELTHRLSQAQKTTLFPLRMVAQHDSGASMELVAINEVSMLRQTRQAAKLRIHVDGVVRLEEMICDGVLLSTPAGSTAYNLSANGPILPLGTGVLALTPISPFRPRRWRGALLPNTSRIKVEILDHYKRPVASVADSTEIRDVVSVEIFEDREVTLDVLFDPGHGLDERVMSEMFQL